MSLRIVNNFLLATVSHWSFFDLRTHDISHFGHDRRYFVPRPKPIFRISPCTTSLPRTALTVVGLTFGRRRHISDFESGVNEFKTACSIRACFGKRIIPNLTRNRTNAKIKLSVKTAQYRNRISTLLGV